jgi:hypothetical protein
VPSNKDPDDNDPNVPNPQQPVDADGDGVPADQDPNDNDPNVPNPTSPAPGLPATPSITRGQPPGGNN